MDKDFAPGTTGMYSEQYIARKNWRAMNDLNWHVLHTWIIVKVRFGYFRLHACECFSSLYRALTLSQTANFRLCQTQSVCRRQFQIWRKCRKWSIQVENTVGKGEITCHKQFLLFPQYFQKAYFPGVSKGVIVWEWLNEYLK